MAITGASGFLGQYLLHSLIHQPLSSASSASSLKSSEIQIHALYGGNMQGFPEAVQSMVDTVNNSSNNNCSNRKVRVQVHALDLTNTEDVVAWVTQYGPQLDVCIHSAALSVPRLCQANPEKAKALNVPSVFLQGLASQNVSIIALSTDQVYPGKTEDEAPYKEDDYTKELPPPVNMYGTTKLQLEDYLTKLSQSSTTSAAKASTTTTMVSLRSSILLGPRAPILGELAHDTFLHFCDSRQDQETTFYTDECRSVIAVDNVVDVILWFVVQILWNNDQQLLAGIYNMGGPDRVSRYDMARTVFEHFGYDLNKLIKKRKASLPLTEQQQQQQVQSPLDIAMDSTKLYKMVGDAVQFKGIEEIVRWTFRENSAKA